VCVQEVPYVVGERLEVRLDKELQRQLEELADQDQTSFSETVRHLMATAYEGGYARDA
jgi:predicted transcriptional regulator